MPFISHAQNHEDVMLWRALGHVERGFYIDVGAWWPDRDSVTLAFSERGWRGINIEPGAAEFEALCERRPGDVNLQTAVGAAHGQVGMFFIPDTGLSTADESIARRHEAAGWRIYRAEVPMTTLAALWDAHVPPGQSVHFLKVDVEGFEHAVLAGGDWGRHRPWVVVVEATLPTSQVENHAQWEPLLLKNGYALVYGDGLNLFYLADEHADLRAAFRYPPNVFDDVVTASTHALGQTVAELEARLAESQEIARQMQTRSEHEAAELRRLFRDRQTLVAQSESRTAELQRRLDGLQSTTARQLQGTIDRALAKLPGSALRAARQAAKAAWWAATPWRLPARLRFLRERLAPLPPQLDLWNDAALLSVAHRPHDAVLWPAQSADGVNDVRSAAHWVLDRLRDRSDLRQRFARALSDPQGSGFADWLAGPGAAELQLPPQSLHHVLAVLRSDYAARARQMFIHCTDVRSVLPHGLTPAGQPALFRWFMAPEQAVLKLGAEELRWLFVQAAENPTRELATAFLFTPAWQSRYPDGLTVFGYDAFLQWFADTYPGGLPWFDLHAWQHRIEPHRQLRQAYFARPEWQAAHPAALQDAPAARAWLKWLVTADAGLGEEARAWCAGLDAEATVAALSAPGLNLIGHFCCPSGLRISAESLTEGLRQAGVQIALRDLRTDITDQPRHVHFDALEDFDVTVVHTQPEPFFSMAYDRSDLCEREPRSYRVAYWYWEFDSIPDGWIAISAEVDEVWAATEFVARGLRDKLSLPVRTLFPGVRLAPFERRGKRHFGIEEGDFTFLFNFHMNSVMERKNPLGLVEAFKAAFRPEERVSLVIKTMFGQSHPAQFRALQQAAAGTRITLIDASLSPDEVLSLTDACDAYVSLHRSEGLGLTMAEAMLLGKPVIATGFSGNMDFMDASNSLLVDYKRVQLGRAMPPYDENLWWAEPSIEHAATLMRSLVDDPAAAADLGTRARQSAMARLSVEAAGRRAASRLDEIRAHLRNAKKTKS